MLIKNQLRTAIKVQKTSTAHKVDATKPPKPVVAQAPSVAQTQSDTPAITTPSSSCTHGSAMNIVAHEDDDILFMNPDLQHYIQDRFCVTSVYLTAGDDGRGKYYWELRERAIEAAYSQMYQQPNEWQSHTVTLNQHSLTLARLPQVSGLTLIFFRLPDGYLHGEGFPETGYQSLASLNNGQIDTIHSVDGASSYSADQLKDGLTALMNIYAPNSINSQNYNSNNNDGDHSDHHAAGVLAEEAFKNYKRKGILRAYAGYTIRNADQNVQGSDLEAKQAAFLTYASYDYVACQSTEICEKQSGYGAYLERQYSRIIAVH